MRDSGYLTIQETAKKLGRPASWVKDQICEGKLGATLAGRQWLISARDSDELLLIDPPPAEPKQANKHFLLDQQTRKPRSAREVSEAPTPTRRGATAERSSGSVPQARDRRPKKDNDRKRLLTQKIKDLDREFDQLSSQLRKAMHEYRAAIESGTTVKPPSDLLHQWKVAKAELRYLVAKADTKGLVLPTNLSIYKVFAQEANLATERKTTNEGDGAVRKPSTPTSGIEGYYGGPSRGGSQEVRMVSADVEARLIIARSKERAAARSMQDRGKNKGAREAARTDWAQARLQAENLERGIQIPRSTSRRVPPLPPSVSPASSVRPVSKKEGTAKKKVGRASTRGATADTLREDKGMSGHGYVRHMNKGGHPAPLGDPASGVVLVVEQPVGIRVREALKRSLRVVGLPKAYVIYASTGLLGEALRSTEPRALVAIGPGAVRDIAAGGYPLVCQTFSEAEPGVWFTWTKATMGLLLPSLIPALDDEAAKREFWRGFLNLRNLAPTQ